MTDKEIVKELSDIAAIMQSLGDLRKAKALNNAVDLIKRLEAPQKCPWCGQLMR